MPRRLFYNKYCGGISVVEIIIVSAIIAIALTGLLGLISFSLNISSSVKKTAQANFLGQETMEAARNFRDGTDWDVDGFGVLNTMIDYYPQKTADSPPKWQMVQGQESVGEFTRKFVIYDVLRDVNGDIVETGGAADPDTKKITAYVSWSEKGITRQVQLDAYFTNWK